MGSHDSSRERRSFLRRAKKTSVHERLYKPCKSKKINVEKFEKTIFTLKKILKKEESRYNSLL